ncbi:hypothetical protein RCL1_000610 [Eukaryota sp. TZLM3-RCL]
MYESKLRGNSIVEVVNGRNDNIRVFIDERTCGCGRWQQLGYPCSHAVAALMKFCKEYFTVERYVNMYGNTIVTPSLKSQWLDVDRPLSPPSIKRRAGRPSVRRKKRFVEML